MKNNSADILFNDIRNELIAKIYDKQISIQDLATKMGLTVDELAMYLSLSKKDYLAYKNIYKVLQMYNCK